MAAAYVQSKEWVALSDGQTVAFGSNVAAGNTIVVIMTWSYAGCPPSWTDSQGNTYTAKLSGTQQPSGGQAFWIFTAPVGSSAADTLTLHAGCGNSLYGVAVEVSGLQSDPFDTSNVNNSTSNPAQAGSITTTTDGQYVGALFYRDTSALSFAPGTGFIERHEWNNNSVAYQDTIQTSAGAINPETTVGGISVGYPIRGYTASFKAATGTTTSTSSSSSSSSSSSRSTSSSSSSSVSTSSSSSSSVSTSSSSSSSVSTSSSSSSSSSVSTSSSSSSSVSTSSSSSSSVSTSSSSSSSSSSISTTSSSSSISTSSSSSSSVSSSSSSSSSTKSTSSSSSSSSTTNTGTTTSTSSSSLSTTSSVTTYFYPPIEVQVLRPLLEVDKMKVEGNVTNIKPKIKIQ